MDIQQRLTELRAEISPLVTPTTRPTWRRQIEEWCEREKDKPSPYEREDPYDIKPQSYWRPPVDLLDSYGYCGGIYNAIPSNELIAPIADWGIELFSDDDKERTKQRLPFLFLCSQLTLAYNGTNMGITSDWTNCVRDLLATVRDDLGVRPADEGAVNREGKGEDLAAVVTVKDLATVSGLSEKRIREVFRLTGIKRPYVYLHIREELAKASPRAKARLPETVREFRRSAKLSAMG